MFARKHGDSRDVDNGDEDADQHAHQRDAFGAAKAARGRKCDIRVETKSALKTRGEYGTRQLEQRLRQRRQQHSHERERYAD